MKKTRISVDLSSIRSDFLVTLRQQLDAVELFREIAGPLKQFVLVIDANILIKTVYWLTLIRKKPKARNELLECLAVGMVLGYVTPRVVDEVEDRLARLADSSKVDRVVWQRNWAEVKAFLRIQEPPPVLVAKYETGRDPDDAPTLALAEHLNNATIVSEDDDIPAMGGRAVNAAFVLEIKNYARKEVVSLSILYGGCLVTIGGTKVVEALTKAVKSMATWFDGLSPQAKALALLPLLFLLAHPTSRSAIMSGIKSVSKATAKVVPTIVAVAVDLAEQYETHKTPAPVPRHHTPASTKRAAPRAHPPRD